MDATQSIIDALREHLGEGRVVVIVLRDEGKASSDDVAKLAKAEFLTVPQAAKLSTLSERTIYRLVDEGKVKGYRSGKAVRVRRLDLDRYLAGRETL